MALGTYSELSQAIADHLERDDLVSHIDDFIDIAEARHKREVRIREMLTRASLTVDDRYVSLPSGYLEAQAIRLLTSPVTVLTQVNLHEMTRIRSDTTGKPSYYTIHAQIEFDKDPDSSYSGEIVYYGALTALSGSNTTNSLLTKAPDVYLYAALLASAPFIQHDERIAVWESLYAQAVAGLNRSEQRGRHVGPLVSRVAGATP